MKPPWLSALKPLLGSVSDNGLRTADIASEGTRRVSTDEMGDAVLAAFAKN